MYRPAAGVYWRDEADVVVLMAPRGGLRLVGPSAECWRDLVRHGGAVSAVGGSAAPSPSGGDGPARAAIIAALLGAAFLEPGDPATRWLESNLLHLPTVEGEPYGDAFARHVDLAETP